MSNDEMPPLACRQVWVFRNNVVLIGERDHVATEFMDTCGNASVVSHWPDSQIKKMLRGTNARLIHGPGAPWSPAEEETS